MSGVLILEELVPLLPVLGGLLVALDGHPRFDFELPDNGTVLDEILHSLDVRVQAHELGRDLLLHVATVHELAQEIGKEYVEERWGGRTPTPRCWRRGSGSLLARGAGLALEAAGLLSKLLEILLLPSLLLLLQLLLLRE